MKRPFRLRALERLRERILKQRRMELAQAARARFAVELESDRLEAQERGQLEELRRQISRPGAVRFWSDQAEACRHARVAAQARLAESRAGEDRAVAAVVAARQQLMVVERLRERREEEARLEEHRAGERSLNDLNAGRYFRRQIEVGERT